MKCTFVRPLFLLSTHFRRSHKPRQLYILSLQQTESVPSHVEPQAQQSLPTFVNAVMKFLLPQYLGNFIYWVTFSFSRRAVFNVFCKFGSLINSTFSGYRGHFPWGVKHPDPEAEHTFAACGGNEECMGLYLLSPYASTAWCLNTVTILSLNLFINASANFTSNKFWNSYKSELYYIKSIAMEWPV